MEREDVTEEFYQNLKKTHIFHPLSPFKPTIGSTLLSEPKESLLHALTLIDNLGSSLAGYDNWNMIQQNQLNRIQPTNIPKTDIQLDFCEIQPMELVQEMTNDTLLNHIQSLEKERSLRLNEYQQLLNDEFSHPIDLVPLNQRINTPHKDPPEYTNFMNLLKKNLSESTSKPRKSHLLDTVKISSVDDFFPENLLNFLQIGTVFQTNSNNFYALSHDFMPPNNSFKVEKLSERLFSGVEFFENFAVERSGNLQILWNLFNLLSCKEQTLHFNLIKIVNKHIFAEDFQHNLFENGVKIHENLPTFDDFAINLENRAEIYLLQGNKLSYLLNEKSTCLYENVKKIHQNMNFLIITLQSTTIELDMTMNTSFFHNFVSERSISTPPVYQILNFPAIAFPEVSHSYNGKNSHIFCSDEHFFTSSKTRICGFKRNGKAPEFQILPKIGSEFECFASSKSHLAAVSGGFTDIYEVIGEVRWVGRVQKMDMLHGFERDLFGVSEGIIYQILV